MSYAFTSTDRDRFSLHDCRAKMTKIGADTLTFSFPDGIFCADYGRDWPNTGAAEVVFPLDARRGSHVFLFRESDGLTVRECVTLGELAEKINGGGWELEFLYRYDGYGEILYTGCLWNLREPGHLDAQLFIGVGDETVFHWDPPAE